MKLNDFLAKACQWARDHGSFTFWRQSNTDHEFEIRYFYQGDELVLFERYYPAKYGGWSDWSRAEFTLEQVLAEDWEHYADD